MIVTNNLINILLGIVMESNTFELVINAMCLVQQKGLENKKEVVMKIIQNSMSPVSYERYAPIISLSIEMIKLIARNPAMLKE